MNMGNPASSHETPRVYEKTTQHFDEAYDIVVVGCGLAGAAAAIEAHDQGLRVLVIEKMPAPGGISATAGGGFLIAHNFDGAAAYLKTTNRDNIPDDVVACFARELTTLSTYIEKMAGCDGAVLSYLAGRGNYAFPGLDSFRYIVVDSIPGFDEKRDWPHVCGDGGPRAFKLFLDNLMARNVPIRLNTSARRLIAGPDGEIRGVWAEGADGPRAIKARRGVVLACGGFEAAPEMQRQYWSLGSALSASFQGNTGDGIRMALDAGADLWHMWHFHGSYGFRSPDPSYPLGIRIKQLPNWVPGVTEETPKMSWIVVDKSGKRFMNEYPPYLQDTGHRALDVVDLPTATFPRIPCYLIADDDGRRLYRLGEPRFNDLQIPPMEWSGANLRDWENANLAEVEAGILRQFGSVAEVAAFIGCGEDALNSALERWNSACESGKDADFGRPVTSMVPVRTPPFIVGELWPIVSNTQGGPAHDAQQRILNPFGKPIPRLYEAGEIGGAWGFLYLGGGNYSECVIGGRIAAKEIGTLRPWDM